jgi:hypothetical protein
MAAPFYFLSHFMKSRLFVTGGVIAFTAAIVLSGCQQGPQLPPDQAVRQGMQKLTTLTSQSFEVALNGNIQSSADDSQQSVSGDSQQSAPVNTQFNITLGGSTDLKDLNDPKINLTLDGTVNASNESGSAAGELRMNKDFVYFMLSKLAIQGADQIPQEFTDTYVGKWWKLAVPPETLKQLTNSMPEGGSSQQASDPQKQQLIDLFNNTQFFKNVQFVATEDVKGEQSAHYTAQLDKDALMTFVQKAAVIQNKPMSDSDVTDMQNGLKNVDFSGGVWIGNTSGIMNQISGNITYTGTTPADGNGTFAVRLTLWNFNQPVAVVAPAGAQDFPYEQLMGALGGAMGGADTSGAIDGTTGATPGLTTTSGDNGLGGATALPTAADTTGTSAGQ